MKALRAEPLSINNVFSGRDFVIPEFQRPYSWGIEQSEQLWIDVSSFIDEILAKERDDKEQYFLGSIVVYPDENNKNVWMIVDGQQRLTTISMLIKLFFESNGTYIVFEKMLYKTDPVTTDTLQEPRLESKVLAGGDQNDYEDFQKVLSSTVDGLPKGSPYKQNYEVLAEKLNEWWDEKDIESRKKALDIFQKNVVLLPIECDTLDDALTLFQIINDRGMSLSDADIFKSRIYGMHQEHERETFIKRWSALDEHESLFRIHMHVIRAKNGDIRKEKGLRSYIQEYLDDLPNPQQACKSIVSDLENYHSVRTQGAAQQETSAYWDERIYWGILKQYPNIYWEYPLYVFLNKYGDRVNGGFFLDEDKHDAYIDLLKSTVRYFYIKGVVYNTVNRVKDTVFKVCSAIEHEGDYTDVYLENIKGDVKDFFNKLREGNYGRYQKGIVWLCSSLNPDQNFEGFATVMESCHVEHILPKNWAHYDGWSDDAHAESVEKIGNKIPLEWKLNIRAANEFFQRKKEHYKHSKIQDALDLSVDSPSRWYPDDVEERQKVVIDRLTKFFEPAFGAIPCA